MSGAQLTSMYWRLQGDGGGRRKRKADAAEAAEEPQKLLVESYAPADPGPYPEDLPPQNPVRFTPMQVAAGCLKNLSAFALMQVAAPVSKHCRALVM